MISWCPLEKDKDRILLNIVARKQRHKLLRNCIVENTNYMATGHINIHELSELILVESLLHDSKRQKTNSSQRSAKMHRTSWLTLFFNQPHQEQSTIKTKLPHQSHTVLKWKPYSLKLAHKGQLIAQTKTMVTTEIFMIGFELSWKPVISAIRMMMCFPRLSRIWRKSTNTCSWNNMRRLRGQIKAFSHSRAAGNNKQPNNSNQATTGQPQLHQKFGPDQTV